MTDKNCTYPRCLNLAKHQHGEECSDACCCHESHPSAERGKVRGPIRKLEEF